MSKAFSKPTPLRFSSGYIARRMLFVFIVLNSAAAVAQQSLFNVPSVETTEKDKFFSRNKSIFCLRVWQIPRLITA